MKYEGHNCLFLSSLGSLVILSENIFFENFDFTVTIFSLKYIVIIRILTFY